jgi:hypothetical protein
MIECKERLNLPPCEFARQIHKVREMHPKLKLSTIADRLGRSADWLQGRMQLLKLSFEDQVKVDSGEMTLLDAFEKVKWLK